MLIEELGLKNARLIALCGAGGKTTLLYALGREWAQRKERVALTTTTHIWNELPPGCGLWSEAEEDRLLSLWAAGLVPVAGRPLPNGKLQGPTEEMWALLLRHASRILTEADGAACHPVKFPAAHEPALPPKTDRVLAVGGLSALDRPLLEVCHRGALALKEGVVKDGPLSEAGLCALLLKGYGRYDPLFLLNQADTPVLMARARRMAEEINRAGGMALPLSLKSRGLVV